MNKQNLIKLGTGTLLFACACTFNATDLRSEAIPVELRYEDGYHLLYRNGEPYFIKGAGGSHDLELLARIGGNSLRTWGPPEREFLDRAHAAGLSVCVGLWIEHERHGFDYGDEAAVKAQIQRHCEAIDRLKDHPAVLLWGIGNEVELEYTDKRVWEVIEAVAAHAKKVDPHHPTMTVMAHIDDEIVAEIKKHCPSIDILGNNSYGGIGLIAEGIESAGWEKPYMITEWGPDGSWEVDKTAWGAEIEPTSTEKAMQRATRYAAIAGERTNCLGGYVFHWGWKQETTPTWFNIFLEDGSPTECLEVIQYLWTGAYPEARAPRVAALRINGSDPEDSLTLAPGVEARAEYVITRGKLEDLRIHWELLPESSDKGIGGDREERPETVDLDALVKDKTKLVFETPAEPGPYRLFLYVYGDGGTAATANFPFLVE